MAEVPGTDQTATALPAGIPDDYQHVSVNPDAFGSSIAQGAQQFSRGMDQVAQSAGQMAQLHDQLAVDNAYTSYQQRLNTISFGDPNDPNNPGYYAKKGMDAVNGYQEANQQAQQARTEILAGLSPSQARIFDTQSRRLMTMTSADFGRHYAQQQGVAADTTDRSSIETDHATAASYDNNPQRFLNSLADSQATVIRMGQRNGWSGDMIQNAVIDNKSKMFSTVAQAKLERGDPHGAWTFLQAHRDSILGTDEAALEAKIRPSLFASGARSSAETIMSGATSAIAGAVAAEANRQGVDSNLALTVAKLESGMGAHTQSPGSSATGVFQMQPATWSANGGTAADRNDVGRQVQLGVQNLATSQHLAGQALNRTPEPWETYLVHQQGAGGGPALLQAPDGQSAVDALTPAYHGNRAQAAAAITGNGGSADMTAGQFRQMWQQRYAQAAGTIPAAGASASMSSDPRAHVQDWLQAAVAMPDPTGGHNPQFAEMVQSHIRSRIGEIEYGQAQAERANKETLLSAVMGVPSLALPSATMTPGATPPPIQPQKPTSLEQVLSTPAARSAWAASTPETQRSVMQMIEANSKEGPPMSQAAIEKYSQLLGMSTNDREGFLKVNLADPSITSVLPTHMVLGLLNEQHRADNAALIAQQKGASLLHAQEVLRPDILASGIDPTKIKAGTPVAQNWNLFTGRLAGAIEDFRTQNNRTPTDDETKKLGQSLLMQGYARGTSGWFHGDSSVAAYQVEPSVFYPKVPDADRQQIVAAYTSARGRAPSDSEIQTAYMLRRAQLQQVKSKAGQRADAGGLPAAQTE